MSQQQQGSPIRQSSMNSAAAGSLRISLHDDSASDTEASVSTAARRLQRPLSLPDTDDTSMEQVNSYLHQYEQDLRWSALSDLFFVVGGAGYVILSFFDVLAPGSDEKPAYVFINICAPVVYLFNAAIDVQYAGSVRLRHGKRKELAGHWNDWRLMMEDAPINADDDPIDVIDVNQYRASLDGTKQDAIRGCLHQSPQEEPVLPWYKRLRRHAAHRRATTGAVVFGIAAILGLAAVLVEYVDDERLAFSGTTSGEAASDLDAVSVHVYVLSAVVCLSGKRQRPVLNSSSQLSRPGGVAALWNSPEVLEDVGDVLFFVGSVVDAVRCDFALADTYEATWSIFSSFLWLIDAMLYLRSDYVMFEHLKQGETEGGVMC